MLAQCCCSDIDGTTTESLNFVLIAFMQTLTQFIKKKVKNVYNSQHLGSES